MEIRRQQLEYWICVAHKMNWIQKWNNVAMEMDKEKKNTERVAKSRW